MKRKWILPFLFSLGIYGCGDTENSSESKCIISFDTSAGSSVDTEDDSIIEYVAAGDKCSSYFSSEGSIQGKVYIEIDGNQGDDSKNITMFFKDKAGNMQGEKFVTGMEDLFPMSKTFDPNDKWNRPFDFSSFHIQLPANLKYTVITVNFD